MEGRGKELTEGTKRKLQRGKPAEEFGEGEGGREQIKRLRVL